MTDNKGKPHLANCIRFVRGVVAIVDSVASEAVRHAATVQAAELPGRTRVAGQGAGHTGNLAANQGAPWFEIGQ